MDKGDTLKLSPEAQARANLLSSRLLVEELSRLGLTRFVICPGSRSTPLVAALAASDSVQTTVHFDERGAAFLALGHARATKHPTAVVCTSGTAAGNILPAVMEASNDAIPLVVLTADRPPELHGLGANQTIRQLGIYANYVRAEVGLPTPNDGVSPIAWLTQIDEMLRLAVGVRPGPIHINCPFRKPLLPEPSACDYESWPASLPELWRDCGDPIVPAPSTAKACSADALKAVAAVVSKAALGLIVIGHLPDSAQQRAARHIANHLGWPVLADITSGLRLGTDLKNLVSAHGLPAYLTGRKDQPRLTVLHLGGRLISEAWLNLLGELETDRYLMLAAPHIVFDPARLVTNRVNCDLRPIADGICEMFAAQDKDRTVTRNSAPGKPAERAAADFLDNLDELTEPGVARAVSQLIRPESVLFLAGSMPVRDVNDYAVTDGPPVPVASNRGVSGIDGTVASAVGYAIGSGRPLTLLTGDLALLHDINSLALVGKAPQAITIVVLNNDGGGIFSHLPIERHIEIFEEFFAAPHGLKFKSLAAAFGLLYRRPETMAAFRGVFTEAQSDRSHLLIEVETNRRRNLELRRELQAIAAGALASE